MFKKLYIGDLDYELTERVLKGNFRNIGEVTLANIVIDRYSGNSRGFGFVEISSEEDAQEAIKKLNGTQLALRKIMVQTARSKDGRKMTLSAE
jgi:cold-inducible RNA-binding protein